jgi:hypothetical protein
MGTSHTILVTLEWPKFCIAYFLKSSESVVVKWIGLFAPRFELSMDNVNLHVVTTWLIGWRIIFIYVHTSVNLAFVSYMAKICFLKNFKW